MHAAFKPAAPHTPRHSSHHQSSRAAALDHDHRVISSDKHNAAQPAQPLRLTQTDPVRWDSGLNHTDQLIGQSAGAAGTTVRATHCAEKQCAVPPCVPRQRHRLSLSSEYVDRAHSTANSPSPCKQRLAAGSCEADASHNNATLLSSQPLQTPAAVAATPPAAGSTCQQHGLPHCAAGAPAPSKASKQAHAYAQV